MVEVINLKTCRDWGKPGDIKIDRTTKWGNPFLMGRDGNRDDVCNKYSIYIKKQIESGNLDIRELKNAKRLGCWCKPLRCHGDELKSMIDYINGGKTPHTIQSNLQSNNFQLGGKMYNIVYMKYISRSDLASHRNSIFVFGDNDQRTGYGGQAKEMRGERNAIGIRVKKSPSMGEGSFYNDEEYIANTQKIAQDLQHLAQAANGKTIVFPEDGVGTGMAMLNQTAPNTFNYLTSALSQIFGIKNGELTSHNKIHAEASKIVASKYKKPGELHKGELIRFGSFGDSRQMMTGRIKEIYWKGTPNENYLVQLSESGPMKLRTDMSQDFNTVVVSKSSNKIERVLELRKKTPSKSPVKRKIISKIKPKKIIKKCKCKPKRK